MAEDVKERPPQGGSGRPRRSGLEDVARLAEVSLATVDRVLNERGNVALDTMRRVIEIDAKSACGALCPHPMYAGCVWTCCLHGPKCHSSPV